jgi:signal transduction histidine kinase
MASLQAGDVDALWLATLQRLVGRASHDVKDSLNGVSVNLEVIRSRAAAPNAPAASVAQFAEAAAQQLDRLSSLLDAVLAMGRAGREPTDVGAVLHRIATLCEASASPADAKVEIQQEELMVARTTVGSDAVRLALAAPLLEVVAGTDRAVRASPVRCRLSADATSVRVTIAAAGRRVLVPELVAGVLRDAGVRWSEGPKGGEGDDLSLAFPRA